MNKVVHVNCLKHVYPDQTEVDLCGLDFVVNKGEKVVILASNGAGKTTLLNHILGFLTPLEGTVEVLGMSPKKDFEKLRKKLGVVFQNVDEQIIGPRVYDDIGFTPKNNGIKKDQVDHMVKEISRDFGIDPLLNKIPHYLSGGQKKKVALAGAMVMNPEILILDEPFESLDPKSKTEMVKHLNHINKEHDTTMIITTHDINLVPEIADVIYVIDRGHVVAKGDYQEVFNNYEAIIKADLEVPILTELFLKLKSRGYDMKSPQNVGDAEKQLLMMFKELEEKQGDK
ncbi:energy-coupling factor ABC transporter ATP-binding protein [Isachenkonia alkalipeptolytica]|uniref:Energy-coupling factor ABC transporter ATP-binding protein n=1 Tax=Isachenkonia alkalipeptolytica TaxID=2565777 RepID=A0AA44BET0_9CLOT|nr:energy-coupling factor ABC transporter ATP-binding protein [Isachenkonia alkalipeptolytica]NBG89639.1 energy-coupling factor ABC transporter ATP-binding protein [Isachenkonia alkalipeptolytica]